MSQLSAAAQTTQGSTRLWRRTRKGRVREGKEERGGNTRANWGQVVLLWFRDYFDVLFIHSSSRRSNLLEGGCSRSALQRVDTLRTDAKVDSVQATESTITTPRMTIPRIPVIAALLPSAQVSVWQSHFPAPNVPRPRTHAGAVAWQHEFQTVRARFNSAAHCELHCWLHSAQHLSQPTRLGTFLAQPNQMLTACQKKGHTVKLVWFQARMLTVCQMMGGAR